MDDHGLDWERAWESAARLLPIQTTRSFPKPWKSGASPSAKSCPGTWRLLSASTVVPQHRSGSQVAWGQPKEEESPSWRKPAPDAPNGLPQRHCQPLRQRGGCPPYQAAQQNLFQSFDELYPGKIQNKTNGITPALALGLQPRTLNLISDTIGDGWQRDLDKLQDLTKHAKKAKFKRPSWRSKTEQGETGGRH